MPLVIVSIAAVLSPLAALAAFLITYQEYVHHYPDKSQVMKTALKAAGFTLFFFLALGMLLGMILPLCL